MFYTLLVWIMQFPKKMNTQNLKKVLCLYICFCYIFLLLQVHKD